MGRPGVKRNKPRESQPRCLPSSPQWTIGGALDPERCGGIDIRPTAGVSYRCCAGGVAAARPNACRDLEVTVKNCACACLGLLMILVAPIAPAQDSQQYARVTADGLRVRADWSLDAEVLTGLDMDDIVPVFARSSSRQVIGEMDDYWYQVEAPDGITGWAFGAFLDLFERYDSSGFAVSVDKEVAQGVTITDCAPFTDGRTGATWPRHLHVVFEEYAGQHVSTLNRQLYVFAVDAGSGGTATTIVTGAPDRLRGLLSGPLTSDSSAAGAEFRDEIPMVPSPSGAHQAFVASAKAVSFDGGDGIRFLTQFVQDLVWPPSESVTYVYQGYTSDGSAYVSASFQVQRPAVGSDTRPRPSQEQIWAGYDEYSRELSTKAPEDFQPDLSLLDALIRSISITW